jgi:Peptide methionine sulfoxide reductase
MIPMVQSLRRFTNQALARLPFASLLAGILLAVGAVLSSSGSAEDVHVVPPPALDETAQTKPASEVAVLAGGCFWGVQGVFQHVKGVTSAVSGYTGGDKATAHYQMVGSGSTGHAESVRITFDPQSVSYGRILQIYFSIAHDPTELIHQGPDTGESCERLYRPAQWSARFRFYGSHQDRARSEFLPGRGLSSGFPRAESYLPLYRG